MWEFHRNSIFPSKLGSFFFFFTLQCASEKQVCTCTLKGLEGWWTMLPFPKCVLRISLFNCVAGWWISASFWCLSVLIRCSWHTYHALPTSHLQQRYSISRRKQEEASQSLWQFLTPEWDLSFLLLSCHRWLFRSFYLTLLFVIVSTLLLALPFSLFEIPIFKVDYKPGHEKMDVCIGYFQLSLELESEPLHGWDVEILGEEQ